MRWCSIVSLCVGLVLVAAGAAFFILFPRIVADKVKQLVPLRPESASLKKWQKVEVPIYMRFYLFDVQNPHDVTSRPEAPVVVERGPYTFLQTREKKAIEFRGNESVIYMEQKYYYFVPELSNGTLEDEVMTINVPVISFVNKISKIKDASNREFVKILISNTVNGVLKYSQESLFHSKTVRELLFDGYNVDFLGDMTTALAKFGIKFPSPLPGNRFGFFVGKNGTEDGPFLVNTGSLDIKEYTKIKEYKNKKNVSHWLGVACNMINGTDGSQFHPEVERSEILFVFNTDLCRSLFFEYEQDSGQRDITTYKFVIPKRFFKAPYNDADSECFCTQPESKMCTEDGVLDISRCRKGAPVAISGPHFYQSSNFYTDLIRGLNASKERHETFLEVEPLTGLVLNAARRLQINVIVENRHDFPLLSNVQSMVMPVLWLQESATVDEKSADRFKSLIQNKLKIGEISTISLMAVGVIIVLIVVVIYIFTSRRKVTFPHNAKTIVKVGPDYTKVPQSSDGINSYADNNRQLFT